MAGAVVLGAAFWLVGQGLAAQDAPTFELPETAGDLRRYLRVNPATEAAFAKLQEQAEAGDLAAISAVAWALDSGTGVKRNRDDAMVWRERAAQIGTETGDLWAVRDYYRQVVRRADDEEERDEAVAALSQLARRGDPKSAVVLSDIAPNALVVLLQQGLTDRNLYRMGVDGAVGPGTRAALADFCQQSSIAGNCLTAFDGDAGMIETVFGAMYPAPTGN